MDMDDKFIREYGFGKSGEYAEISVSDTGIGMDNETRGRVFEPCFTTKKEDNGTGFGLSTVYSMIMNHNGYINVSSEPGKGTSFKIYLPLLEA
jgi:signal transduction histidine kinase